MEPRRSACIGQTDARASADYPLTKHIAALPSPQDSKWNPDKIVAAHKSGVNAVSWAPLLSIGPLGQAAGDEPRRLAPRLVSCGCDDELKIWTFKEDEINGGWRASQFPEPVLKVRKDKSLCARVCAQGRVHVSVWHFL
jgi:hypothetical protein